MVGVYFSGTGNTKYCLEKFLKALDEGAEAIPIEGTAAMKAVKNADEIVFAYPVYYSNLPKIVRDYICDNSDIWRGKRVFIIATMGLFSGDGTGCSARLFKKYGAKVIGGLHLKMPDCIGDVKLLKKPLDKNRQLIKQADEKILKAADKIKRGKYPKEGLGFFYHVAGLFGQRLYFPNKTKKYYDRAKVDGSKCVACGLCASVCPMKNIHVDGGKIMFNSRCTMCYRCFSNCPQKAITIIGKQVYEQSKIEKYLDEGKFMKSDCLFKIVKEQIDKFDAYGLLATGCPEDEFDSESALIARKLNKGMNAEKIAEIMAGVMNDQFEKIFKPKDFINAAQEIKRILDNCES